jgi:autotransporter-associated beta strand protein
MHRARLNLTIFLQSLRAVAAAAAVLAAALPARGQVTSLSKGQQILVDRGLQLNGLVALTSDPFHLSTLQSTNFTAPLWAWTSDVSKLGAAPGAPWAKWFDYTTQNDLTAAESPYRSNLVQLYVGDEQALYQSNIFTDTVNWFNANGSKFPTSMLLTNQWGTEVAEATMIDFVSQANPDAVNFDNYPYVTGGGSYIAEEYADLSKYRRLGLGSYIGASGNAPRPYGVFIQTYQSSGDGRRAPSDSEMRRDLFAAWTAGFSFASTFTYNSGATTLFTNGGDNMLTTLGTQFKETARQSRNLGPTLVKLMSKGAATRFIAGQDSAGTVHDVPSGWTPWAAGAEGDPYTTSITVANTGTKNNGKPGDVLVGYFNPMLDTYDGPAYINEQYFMVTNGLADPTGVVADCKQDITLDFEFSASGINSLQRLRRSDGQVETVPLTQISGNHYRVTLALDGGTGDLFKFNDGAPFVGAIAPALLYWDSDSSAANNNPSSGAGTGGSGTWNSSNSTWYNGGSNSAWSAGTHAIFWGTAGTVTLAAPQSAGSLAFLTDGYTLTGSTLTMSGAAIMADTGVTANIGSVVSGTLGIIKNGSGTVNLTAANTYAGGTTINGGVLGIASSSALGALPAAPTINIAINNGATLGFNANGIVLDANRQIQLGSGGGVINTNGNDAAVAGVISGSTLAKAGTGTLALSGNNSHSATVINGGAISVSSDVSLGAVPAGFTAGNITLNGGTLQFGASFDISNNRGITLGAGGGTIDTQSFSNPSGYNATAGGFTGSGDLTKLGAGTFFAAATSGGLNTTWKGKLIIKQGTWKIVATDGLPYNAPSADGLQAAQVTLDGGAWQIGANINASNPRRGITVASGGGTIDTQSNNLTWAGPLNGSVASATLNKIGSGTLSFNSSTYASGYMGNFNVNGGTLVLSGGTSMGDLAAVNLANTAGVSLSVSGGTETIGSLAGGGASGGNVSLSSSLVTGGNNNSSTFNGIVSGAGGLTKMGSGTFTLAPSSSGNLYTGATTVAAGTLLVTNTTGSGTGTGPVAVNAGAALGGTGTIQGNVTNSGTLAPGASPGTLHLGGKYTQSTAGRLEIELASTTNYDELSVTGSATLAGTLAVSLIGGFLPNDGDVFQIMTASGFGGSTFAQMSLPALAGELFWNVNYSTNSVSLVVAAPGDFNGDRSVDAADYLIWRKGSPTLFGPLDYNAWRRHFGATYSSSAASAELPGRAVPEPGSLPGLSLLAIVVLMIHRDAYRCRTL